MAKLDPATPTMAQVIREAIERRLVDLHTAMPGIIESYDPATQLASVRPALKRKYADGVVVELPLIGNVPVAFPQAAGAFISLPVAKGDEVLLVFSERSIDHWIERGGVIDPADSRKHHISDAIALAGLASKAQPITEAHAEYVRIQNAKIRIDLSPEGKVEIYDKESGKGVLSTVSTFIQAVIDARTATIAGPQPLIPTPPTAFVTAKVDIDALRIS